MSLSPVAFVSVGILAQAEVGHHQPDKLYLY